jgi:hypothetical protein
MTTSIRSNQLGFATCRNVNQVRPLVFGFIEQRLDPAAILLEAAQTAEASERAANHARNRCDGLQNHGAMAVATLKEGVGEESQDIDEPQRQSVGKVGRFVMRDAQLGVRWGSSRGH